MQIDSFIGKDTVFPFPLDGKMFLNNQRVFMTSTAAMGLLRKNLIDMVGKKRSNQFLVLHGWSLGVHDATVILQNNSYTSKKEMILAGPKLHMQQGHLHVQTNTLEIDLKNNGFYMEGLWKYSHEAEEHKKYFGISDEPTCYKMVGYASGYISTILGFMVIVKEIKCEGKGDDYCHWVAKPLSEFKDSQTIELFNFNETSMIKELELAYEQIKEERDNLNKTYIIHKRLTRELVQGHGLQSIATVLHETLEAPILIEDQQFNVIAAAGLIEDEKNEYNQQMKCFVKTKKHQFNEIKLNFFHNFKPAKVPVSQNHFRLLIPILLNNQITGYCSIIRPVNEFTILEKMMIDRSSVVCAMYLLNERTTIEAEQRMRGNILEEIIAGRLSRQEIMKMGQYVHADFSKPFHIVVLNICNEGQNMKTEIEWKDEIITKLTEFFNKESIPILLTNKCDHIVLYIPNDVLLQRNRQIQELVGEILFFCSNVYTKSTFCGGISTCQQKIEAAKNQFDEALTAVKLSTKSKPLTLYEELGIIGLLMQTGDKEAIRKYSKQVLSDILDYDHRKGMDLTKTLYHYILNGGNLEQTACSSALSISGLRYRIEKIKDILSVDIRQPSTSYSLFLAIQTLIILGEIQFDL
ncbi:XylR N-terminal domain-containing protein [Schinkia sp. CFF1]